MSTIRDIAKACDVSSTTVSLVLAKASTPCASIATRRRIELTAKKLGYRNLARWLRSKYSYTIGVMVLDMTHPYCTLILRGIGSSLVELGYLPILTDVHNERTRFERYLEMMLDRGIKGLIVLANGLFVDIDLLADLEKSSVPTGLIGHDLRADNVSSVIVDNEIGGQMAIEHLYSLGHRKIAFIRGPKTLSGTSTRWKGVRAFAQSKHLELDSRLVLELPESSDPASSFEAGQKLTEELLKRRQAFSALMAFDDMTAFGAIRALTRASIRIPEQCSIIGFDDVAPAALFTPSLTTIRKPMEAMGSLAVRLVVDGINSALETGKVSASRRKIAPELVVRESTRAVN